jgi:hypothetical protein
MATKCRAKESSAKQASPRSPSSYFFVVHFFVFWLAAAQSSVADAACPFCTALGPTLSQRRDEADATLLGEIESIVEDEWSVRVHHVLRDDGRVARKNGPELVRVPANQRDDGRPAATGPSAEVGSLLVAFGLREPDSGDRRAATAIRWSSVTLNEASYVYVAKLPDSKLPAGERLGYFAHYLEHADPLIAQDAYWEFGHAPFADVLEVADCLSFDSLVGWLRNPRVPPERKGFYALALAVAGDEIDRARAAEELWRAIIEPADDFRAGFDGWVGGYLLAAGAPGLQRIERRFLTDPAARPGDVRHVMAALRFYHEEALAASQGGIAAEQIERAYHRLLVRQELAALAITDLTRWEAWDALDDVVALFGRPSQQQPAIERAIFGFLLSAPTPEARRELSRLKAIAPERCAEAEQMRRLTSGAR